MKKLLILFLSLTLLSAVQLDYSWSEPQLFTVLGYPANELEQPFLSRDGQWLFFNSQNTGPDTSLYYALILNSTFAQYMGPMGGEANEPSPHLDAVPSMDVNYHFYWTSTRDYPSIIQNVMTGIFNDDGNVTMAYHLPGNIYFNISTDLWIVMDLEINANGSILFYVNGAFSIPPGPTPVFSNISIAMKNEDGSFTEHPNAKNIMFSVNNLFGSQYLRFAPSSFGDDGLELYFTCEIPNSDTITGLFVANRASLNDVFGEPRQVFLSNDVNGEWLNPDGASISSDGKTLMFTRIDRCNLTDIDTCKQVNIYTMKRVNQTMTTVGSETSGGRLFYLVQFCISFSYILCLMDVDICEKFL